MCGRYPQAIKIADFEENYEVRLPPQPLPLPRFNVAPTQNSVVIRQAEGEREATVMKWGLIPSWAKDASIAYKTINAKAETVEKLPSFRAAYKSRRCIVPVSGFYEWLSTAHGKLPYLFYLSDHKPFGLAGLWERWHDLETFTIITTTANRLVERVHERMPVIIDPELYKLWLDPGAPAKQLKELLQPFPWEAMSAHLVSPKVNNPKNDTADCLQRAALPLTATAVDGSKFTYLHGDVVKRVVDAENHSVELHLANGRIFTITAAEDERLHDAVQNYVNSAHPGREGHVRCVKRGR